MSRQNQLVRIVLPKVSLRPFPRIPTLTKGNGTNDNAIADTALAARRRFLARRYRTHSGIDKRDLCREKVAEQSRNTPRHVNSRPPERGRWQDFDACNSAGRGVPGRPTPHQAETLGNLSPPVRNVALLHRSTTIARGISP